MSAEPSERDDAPLRGAVAARRWANALGVAGAATVAIVGLRLWDQSRRLGSFDLVEAIGAGLAVAVVGVAFALRLGAARDPAGLDAAPLGARTGFIRLALYAAFAAFLSVAFSRLTGIVGRFVIHEMSVCLGVGGLLLAARRVDPLAATLGKSRLLATVDVLLFNVLLAAVLIEGGVRVYMAVRELPPQLAWNPGALAFKLPPDKDGANPQGYMDAPFTEEKPDGMRRVVVLGDSFCAGHVGYEPNWLTVAERRLQARPELGADGDTPAPVEIYNLGIHNASPREYLDVLEREGLRYDPDLVVLSFYVGNDVSLGYVDPHPLYKDSLRSFHVLDRMIKLKKAKAKAAAEAETGKVRLKMSPERYARQQRRHMRLSRRGEPDLEDERKWAAALGAVARVAAICRERGIAMMIVVAPDAFQVDADVLAMALAGVPEKAAEYPPWKLEDFDLLAPQARVAAFAAEAEIELLDLMPAFDAANARGEGPFYLERNAHWNEPGNLVAGEALAEALTPRVAAWR